MTQARLYILLAAGGSAALMLAALGFQYLGDLAPCKLCIWQRYPHVAAIGLGSLAWLFGGALLPALGMLAALTTAGVGGYHAGVEQGWWEGPSTCTSGPVGGLSTDELMAQIMSAPLVRCDEIPWELFGLSMAGWNMLVSLGLAGLWLMAIRAR
ncbi:disulfide bond formation protein B [Roseovarius aestuariivivens]|uniref:disulfide bond formation protein B n=1 Tax=Roseovarius aestuariivivens TaxID=1888910 RepID=UPI001081C720|nr:disulfide bond formation protein B [Roseovarius aestuariivivens]